MDYKEYNSECQTRYHQTFDKSFGHLMLRNDAGCLDIHDCLRITFVWRIAFHDVVYIELTLVP